MRGKCALTPGVVTTALGEMRFTRKKARSMIEELIWYLICFWQFLPLLCCCFFIFFLDLPQYKFEFAPDDFLCSTHVAVVFFFNARPVVCVCMSNTPYISQCPYLHLQICMLCGCVIYTCSGIPHADADPPAWSYRTQKLK